MQKLGASKQIKTVEEVKNFLQFNFQDQQNEKQHEKNNKCLSFQRRARSKSPPIIFGQGRSIQNKVTFFNQKVIPYQEVGNLCAESTQASSRFGTQDYQKETLNNQLKEFINNQLGKKIGEDEALEDPEFLNLLNREVSNSSNDLELEQWLKGQSQNPFSIAQDLDFDELRESLHSCRSSNDVSRDSDWLYQTTNK